VLFTFRGQHLQVFTRADANGCTLDIGYWPNTLAFAN